MAFDHLKLEKKWQKEWNEKKVFEAKFPSTKPKYYALDMFPYPSGAGLHVGHLASYIPGDVVSRFKRSKGFNVLHPMGYDAFGLPAEQYAIQTGVHPAITTQKAIENFRSQLDAFGFSFDWSKTLATTDPKFLKWTQFIFTKLHEAGLAYEKEVPVNWCPAMKTVLANEEVVDGKSERGGHPVERLPMKQWMLKITEYAERLLKDLETIDWPQRTKEGQKNWIGKSVGAEVSFKVKGSDHSFNVFTTRPDTLFGATFMVIAPEHPLALELSTSQQSKSVEDYIETSKSKSELARKASTEKTGVFTGAYCLNPISGDEVPLWVSDYVLMDYGTGAIMAVPGHDERDFEFAKKFDLPVKRVLEGGDLPYVGEGELVNSDFLNGLKKSEAIEKAINFLEEKNIGEKKVQYKLRDWLFSRQRYWGEPIPIIHLNEGGERTLNLDELPLTLPEVADYEPTDDGEPPLSNNKEWMKTSDGLRAAHTMPGTAGSAWYYLRYPDTENENEICSKEKLDYWLPVDLYVGGPEHTVSHLLYSRFWNKFLFDKGLATHPEPFMKLAHQGMILGPDGEKMSKSRGNVINPDDVRLEHGADAVRVYMCFMGPFERDKPWNTQGIEGSRRFLERVWRLCIGENKTPVVTNDDLSLKLEKSLHKAIKKVTLDIEAMSFNTAISAMMILVNDLYKEKSNSLKALKPLVQLLHPFAPHMCEEIWETFNTGKLVCEEDWPAYDESLCVEDSIEMGVQVSGKMRGKIQVTMETSEEEALGLAKELSTVQAQIDGKNVVKVIYKAGKILNIIAK